MVFEKKRSIMWAGQPKFPGLVWQASPTLRNHFRSECQTRWRRLVSRVLCERRIWNCSWSIWLLSSLIWYPEVQYVQYMVSQHENSMILLIDARFLTWVKRAEIQLDQASHFTTQLNYSNSDSIASISLSVIIRWKEKIYRDQHHIMSRSHSISIDCRRSKKTKSIFFQESQKAMDRKVWNLMTLLPHMSSIG